jgi:hypothetical protein
MPMVSALRAVLFYSTGVSAVRHIAILAFFIDDYLFGSIAKCRRYYAETYKP